MVSAYMGGTCGSGVLSSAGDVLEMSVVRDVCDMCMCLARGGWEVLGARGLGFTNPGATGHWKFWWAIGMHYNGHPPGEWKKIDNIMVTREFIIVCAIKHHSDSPITISNLFFLTYLHFTRR